MANSSLTPFSGSSRTVVEGKQASGSSEVDVIRSLFSDQARKEFAKECKLGMYTNLSSNNRFNYIDLVPKTTGSRALSLFKSEYEKGRIPSSGVLSIPRVLVFLVRTCSETETGTVTVKLVDVGSNPGLESMNAVDGTQECTISISKLPALVCFSPSYDCPMEVIGNRNRCFGLVTQLNGTSTTGATLVMSHAYWQADFRLKPNNYKAYSPGVNFIESHDRLRSVDRKDLVRYVKGITNRAIDEGPILGSSTSVNEYPVRIVELEEESPPEAPHDSKGYKVNAVTANTVAGLPVSGTMLTRR